MLLLGGIVAGCSSDGEGPPKKESADELSFELFAETRQLGDADLAFLTSSADDGTLTFASEPPALAGVAVGQVLLAGMSPKTPKGLLRVVTGIDRTNGFVVQTAAAPIQAAFRKLHVRTARTAEPFAPETTFDVSDTSPLALRPQFTIAKGKGERAQSYEIVVFDGDGDVNTTNDQIKIDATLGGGFGYALSIDVDWGAIDKLPQVVSECLAAVAKIIVGDKPSCRIEDLVPEAKTRFDVTPFVTLDVGAVGAASLAYEKSFDVGAVSLPPFAIGPLVFAPSVDILAKVEGGASARFDVRASARADLEASVVVSSKSAGTPQYVPPRLKDYKVEAHPPTIDLHANAKAEVGARLNASLYGIIGPYATVSGVAAIDAAPLENPCWKLRFALQSKLGVRITSPTFPGLGYFTIANASTPSLTIIDEEVASGTCIVPPDPPRVPGGGPTPTVYQTPTFTPWAKMLSTGTIDGAGAISMGMYLGSNATLTPTIDGRLLVGAPYALGLHKLDEEGNLTWASKLTSADGTRFHRVLRSVPTTDAGIISLVRPEDTAAFVLSKATQAGTIEWSTSYSFANDCVPTASDIVRDPGKGHVVIGRCSAGQGWLVRVDEQGAVLRARTFEEDGATRAYPVTATLSEGEVVVAGEVTRPNELEWSFVSRLDGEDRPVTSTAFQCPDRVSAQPTSVIPSEAGGVTVVGTANGLGMVARVRRDGTLGFASYPNVGTGVPDSFVIGSVVELPTTGMVIGASAVDVSTNDPATIVLAGLDSAGSVLWSRQYSIATPSVRPASLPAMRLTDDGGIYVTAVGGSADGQQGDLYAMKVFAKDGHLTDGQALAGAPITVADAKCATVTRPFAPVVRDVVVTGQSFALVRR